MNSITRLLTLLTFAIMTTFAGYSAETDDDGPDFAYPRTVAADAEAALRLADANSNAAAASAQRLRAALELLTAQREVNSDTMFLQPALVAQLAARTANFAPGQAMLTLLEARVLSDIYQADSYTYDEVSAPLEPYPAEVAQWSGRQFKARMRALVEQALGLAARQSQELSLYRSSLEADELGMKYMPLVYDFVAWRGAEILRGADMGDAADSICAAALAASAPESPSFFFWTTKQPGYDISSLAAYRRYAGVEAARYLLYSYWAPMASDDDAASLAAEREYVDALRTSLRDFPSWPGNPALALRCKQITNPVLDLQMPGYTGTGSTTKVEGTYRWTDKISIDVYFADRRPGESEDIDSYLGAARHIMTYSRNNNGVEEVQSGKIGFTVPPVGQAGFISLRGVVNDTVRTSDLAISEVMPLMTFSINGNRDQGFIAVEFGSGKPIGGVKVIEKNFDYRTGERDSVPVGRTDRKGILLFTPDSINQYAFTRYLAAEYQGRSYDFSGDFRVSNPSPERSFTTSEVRILTDRPLYHPGDTVAWAVAAVKHNSDGSGYPYAGDATVKFYDANRRLIAATDVTTDSLGRAGGKFVIPRGRLTGRYSLEFKAADMRTWESVMVSDFRMPTFEVEITRTERDVPAAGAVRLQGKVMSYAGMALSDVRIEAAIKAGERWWRGFMPTVTLGNVEAVSDANGSFTLDIPAELLETDDSRRDYQAIITATNAAGETADTETAFTTGKPYVLALESPEGNVNTDSPVSFMVKALDMQGDNSPLQVQWSLAGADSTVVARGNAVTGTPFDVNLGAAPAGKYTLTVTPADTTLASPLVKADAITAYSLRRNAVPSCDGFFLPTDNATAGSSLKVGVTREKAWIYAAWTDATGRIRVRLYEQRRGFADIAVPADAEDMVIITVSEGKAIGENIRVRRAEPAEMGIVAETFRDRLTPGATETWRFRLTDSDGTPVAGAAMIARMYNHALDALWPTSAPQPFRPISLTHGVSWSRMWMPFAGLTISPDIRTRYNSGVELPAFRFLDRPFTRDFNAMLFARAECGSAPMADGVSYGAPRMAVAAGAVAPESADIEADEAAPEAKEAAVAEPVEAGEAAAPEVKYRASEVLQAFFRPTLTADADGNVDIVFTVPDANASWTFQAFVWNSRALGAVYDGRAISSKPVMVQPNLPRFLRQGDRARLLTTVYNNTGADAAIITVAEIFDMATGAVTGTVTSTDTIAAGASAVVAIDVEAPTDAAAVGFRVRATDGTFADGERSAIPVLDSAATVVESTEFYVNPGTAEPFTADIDMEPGFSYTLQYCDNPIWTVVKALRGTSGRNSSLATGLASHIFSLYAGGIVADANPTVGSVVRQWQNADGGSALTSMLDRNDALKLMMLENTPWLQTAADESARMASLAALFDADTRAADLEKAIGKLRDLQNADGGFAWGFWSGASSPWVTRSVLTTFGLARSLGAAWDSDIDNMLGRALQYVCDKATEPRHPATDAGLAVLARLYPDFRMPEAAAGLVEATRASIKRNWRNDGTVDRAWDIIILGADSPASVMIYVSVRQFAVMRPDMGMCFPSVDDMRGYATIMQAYKLMGAPAADLDAMRQWVIVQAQATDDLSARNPDYIIAALMTSGTDWSRTAPVSAVTLGGRALQPGAVEAASGYFAMPLAGEGTERLVVAGNGVTPAYGSVTGIGQRPAATVEARAGRDVSVTKRVLVNRGGEWVATDSLALGERARVQLTIVAARDMEYVTVTDERPAAFAPVEQMPGSVYSGGLAFYRVPADARTDLFIGYLPAGTYHIEYDMTAAVAGEFISGIATLQSQYDPALTAHSAGNILIVK